MIETARSTEATSDHFDVVVPTRADFRRYAHRWLLLIPFVWQIGLAPFFNSETIRILSLPLPMVWQMSGILVATFIIGLVFHLDEKLESTAEEPEPLS